MVIVPLLLLLCAAPPAVSGAKVAPGVYRFSGEGEVAAPAAPLVAILTAYDQQCKRGCRYTVPSVDRTEILPGEKEGRFYTWSYIDDVLDASYFSAIDVTRDGARTTVHFGTPDAATLARLVDAAHPHDPFFHHQEGTWTFEELPATPGAGPRTRVTVEIEMRSDSFLVNLIPGQIVDKTKKHLMLIYGYYQEAALAGGKTP